MPFRTPFRSFDPSRAAAAAALLALLAGCGGGTTNPSDDDDGDDPPAGGGAGTVTVTISGLPDSTDAAVTIQGGNGFVRPITGTAVVDSVPAGSCTITASPVTVAPGDTLFAAIPVRTVPIVAGDTTYVTVAYEAPPEPGDLTMTVYHGPLVFQGARYSDYWNLLEDYGQPPIISLGIDEYSLPYPAGYIIDNCQITGTDVTGTGVDIGTSISGQFGSGSADASLTVDSATSVTVTASASGTSSASTAYVGNGVASGVLSLGYSGSNRLYDLCIDIANPDGSPFDLVFTWSYSGSVANTEYAIWHQRFVYQIDPLVCGQNALPTELFHGTDFEGPASDSGTLTIPLTGTHHLVGFGMWTEASGNWHMDFLGRGGDGSASCTGSVTIEVVR